MLSKHPNQAIVETHGVGYDVDDQRADVLRVAGGGQREVALHIHTHVREDALSLYGFLRLAEKQLFEKLLTVSGIGPKLAITILSGMATDEMVNAIRGGDVARLTRIPGIGKKTAERMVLELRDKITGNVWGGGGERDGSDARGRGCYFRAGQPRIPTRGGGKGAECRAGRGIWRIRWFISRGAWGAGEVAPGLVDSRATTQRIDTPR